MKTIFEKSVVGRSAVQIAPLDVPERDVVHAELRRKSLDLPQVAEIDLMRHYIHLSRRNFGVDLGFYPLGSCTMKYNPKINEEVARYSGFASLNPNSPELISQGALQVLYELSEYLRIISGMDAVTLQPAAGAHGELCGIMVMKEYFAKKNELRSVILIPDSAHGTNPATATMCGFTTVQVKSNQRGSVDLDDLRQKMNENVVGLMITNPNTLGLFDDTILEIVDIVHAKGGLVYCDGANQNANMGVVRPGDLGIDVMHFNLHKSFSTPHGGGGPGAGPIAVKAHLAPFLPVPRIVMEGTRYTLDNDAPDSIGSVRAFYGNFGILLRAYTYIRGLGAKGIREAAENAVLNANYLLSQLRGEYHLAYDRVCQHEFVLDDSKLANGVTTNDIAKRLLDYGFHAPTIYFPLIVHGAIMIEPTETESKDTLDVFSQAMHTIAEEARSDPEKVKGAPWTTPVRRVDAVKAAREIDVACRL